MRHQRHAGQRRAEEDAARGDHHAGPAAIGHATGEEAEHAVREGVERERARQAGPRPAELVEERREEHAERVLSAVGDEEDQEGAGDDDPAIERPGHVSACR